MFGNDRAVKFVAIVSPEDMAANAEFVRMADQTVDAPAGSNNNNYANVNFIVDIAVRMKVQAVWAGWGHASENPKLPDQLHANNIVFMGPPGHAMRSLGDKISSMFVAQAAKVPCIPWTGTGVEMDARQTDKTGALIVPQEIYDTGCVKTATEGLASAKKIGFPVMIKVRSLEGLSAALGVLEDCGRTPTYAVALCCSGLIPHLPRAYRSILFYPTPHLTLKASEGGGGKGIRKVTCEEDFPGLFRQVLAEVPGSPVFIMQLAGGARHLEVQLLADNYGNVISLFGRDCSVQRRHQKIIEEAPASIAPPIIFDEMEKAAVRLAKLVNYESVGTVEFLFNDDGSFAFLELNPRLQVEHPCSEMVSGVNLPAAQLQVAMGVPLHRNMEIRTLYGKPMLGTDPIPFDDVVMGPLSSPEQLAKPTPLGAVVACRITAENPEDGFKPQGGQIKELTFRSSKDVWGYFSVRPASGLHEFADSQFGHVFAWGETREQARRSMVLALKELSIRGDFRTTVEYLQTLLETDDFTNNKFSTEWLDGLIKADLKAERPDTMTAIKCGAVHIADTALQMATNEYTTALSRGQIPPFDSLNATKPLDIIYDGTKYSVAATRVGPSTYALILNESFVYCHFARLSDGGSLVRLSDGTSRITYATEEVERYRMAIAGQSCDFDKDNDPTIMRSTTAGKLLRYLVDDGGHIAAGEAYAEIEVMKMVMNVYAKATGTIKHTMVAGGVIGSGDVMGTLELDDPSKVTRANPFTELFADAMSPETMPVGQIHQQFQAVTKEISSMLDGYALPEPFLSKRLPVLIDTLFVLCQDRKVPLLEARDILFSIQSRIPETVFTACDDQLNDYEKSMSSLLCKFPAKELASIIDRHAASLDSTEQGAFILVTGPLQALIQRFRFGLKGHLLDVVQGFLNQYLNVERVFNTGRSTETTVEDLQAAHTEKKDVVVAIIYSHSRVAMKNSVIKLLLDKVYSMRLMPNTPQVTLGGQEALFQKCLEELATLTNAECSKIALATRTILIRQFVPPYADRKAQMEKVFLSSSQEDALAEIVGNTTAVFDVLSEFLFHEKEQVQRAALEVYIRRAYVAYSIDALTFAPSSSGAAMIQYKFHLPATAATDLQGASANTAARLASVPSSSGGGGLKKTSKTAVSMGDIQAFERAHANDAAPTNSKSISRTGVITAFKSIAQFKAEFDSVSALFKEKSEVQEPVNVLMIAIQGSGSEFEDKDESGLNKVLADTVKEQGAAFRALKIRRVTFVVVVPGSFPNFYTFRESVDFAEDLIYRHVDPALAFKLEMFRIRNYNITRVPVNNSKLHVYHGKGIMPAGSAFTDHRFFIRSVMRFPTLPDGVNEGDFLLTAGETQLIEALDELEVAFANPTYGKTDCNHLFINAVPVIKTTSPVKFAKMLQSNLINRYRKRLWKLRVLEAEIRITFKPDPSKEEFSVRFVVTNESGYYMNMNIYKETLTASGEPTYAAFDKANPGPLDGKSCYSPYELKDITQTKRYAAQQLGSTYAYDYTTLMREVISQQWAAIKEASPGVELPKEILSCVELVLNDDDELVEQEPAPGKAQLGMVAWKCRICTPDAPTGRDIILISNDVTFFIGSFGPREDLLFARASELSRKLKIPRVYVSVNSGARIGLANEVMALYRVAWEDDAQPWKGYKYLYLTPEDYRSLNDQGAVEAEAFEDGGELRYKITDIIGTSKSGLGVECLKASGMIAGETSMAYEETFTCTLVSCRSVGIGAYLVRLGQRTVQGERSHIILTGAGALNKVLGKKVYTSNRQLGGPQIMYNNGVSHLTVRDDFDGMKSILHWISYLPVVRGTFPPIAAPLSIGYDGQVYSADPVDRDVTFVPPTTPYDPRVLITGQANPPGDGSWESGLFDKGSFVEMLGGWAKTVITGRARLGGIPVGVVAVETNAVELIIPADPANKDSEAQVSHQAGQVWYPDSAFKTATAIKDINKEGLPLVILANWRGFSGGQRDMYEEVLKFGAMIVDNLHTFKQPVVVYIPPGCELRGGAWVVVDPSINPNQMEMYADTTARGGVLEAAGTVEIKYRTPALMKTMARLDTEYGTAVTGVDGGEAEGDALAALKQTRDDRYKLLSGMYHQVAVEFAGLHDTPGRMKNKNVIRDIVAWKGARKYFYWRLRRRVCLEMVRTKIKTANADMPLSEVNVMLRRWFFDARGSQDAYLWDDDAAVVAWVTGQMVADGQLNTTGDIATNLSYLSQEYTVEKVKVIGQTADSETKYNCALSLVDLLSADQKAELMKSLKDAPVEAW
jgi:acetyl-CoA carboxylase/biotin carboxylase 1